MKLIGFFILFFIFLFILVGACLMFSMIADLPKETDKAIASNDADRILTVGSLNGSKWFICIFETVLMLFAIIMIVYLIYAYARKDKTYEGFGFGTNGGYIAYYIALLLSLAVFSITLYIQATELAQSSNCDDKDKAPALFAAAVFSSIFLILILILWLIVPGIKAYRARSSSFV